MPRLIFIGTSHIADQSIRHIKQAYKKHDPDIIAIELDKQRLHALMTEQRPSKSPALIRKVGLKGYLFAIIGSMMQQRLGKAVGITPGADMKTAATLAINDKKPVALIDQDISTTLRKLNKAITRKEKWRFASDLLLGRWKKKSKIKIDLKNVPEGKIITALLEQLRERYPSFHQVLVQERNEHMARALINLARKHQDKTILVVIGAGHLQGVQEILTRAGAKPS